MQLVCASANPDKVAEITALLDGIVELLPRPTSVGEIVEDAGTLEGNARLKAQAICEATGLPAVADDTGLFVDALDGAPGVDTAYFAGPTATYAQNRHRLLSDLAGEPNRRARFVTVVVVAWPDGTDVTVRGECPGVIADDERGERGFGYDPVFIPDGAAGRTFAQMSEGDKHAISHRGKAFAALAVALGDRLR
jgi:XTP/dITP diphosphohydrolase